nr:DegV family protein [Enterococcus ureilyticus]
MTVAQKLSGTFQMVKEVARKISSKNTKVEVIDSKQNFAAQGLLVMNANELFLLILRHYFF